VLGRAADLKDSFLSISDLDGGAAAGGGTPPDGLCPASISIQGSEVGDRDKEAKNYLETWCQTTPNLDQQSAMMIVCTGMTSMRIPVSGFFYPVASVGSLPMIYQFSYCRRRCRCRRCNDVV
jgi:hypothetical protein